MNVRAAFNAVFKRAPAQLGLWDGAAVEQSWRVRESQRARRLTARVFHDGRVEIVVPCGTRQRMVSDFVARHRSWIERARERAQRRAAAVPAAVWEFPPQRLQLAALGMWLDAGQLRVSGDTPADTRELLREQLRQLAQASFMAPLRQLATAMSTDFAQLQLRWQRSRWGSCSRRGTISLNACLLFQRPEVVRYLMIHELSHRHHMHHGPAFWQRVAQFEPDWRALDRELCGGWQRVPRWILSAAAIEARED
jgi:predicted metal-dependent hydrolase